MADERGSIWQSRSKLFVIYLHSGLVNCRTRSLPIRTFALMPVQIKITLPDSPPVHQVLATKIKQMKTLGMTNQEIADSMKISRKTVKKGLTMECSRVFGSRSDGPV